MTEARDRWIELIKQIREEEKVNIFDAERIALSRSAWRRWVEHQLSTDAMCQKMARYHIRIHGAGSLIEETEIGLKVK